MTVYCGPSTDAEARAVARMIAKQFSPIELTADRLCHTERYTKTLFVQFQESAAVRQMFETAARGLLSPIELYPEPASKPAL